MTASTATRLPFASRSSRFVGQFLDGLVAGAPLIVGGILSLLHSGLGALLIMAGVAWALFYNLFADGFHGGQSFAKQWLGMQVVDANTGKPCTFGQSFIRNLLLAMLGPIDWVFIFGDKHQRLGDKAAGTIVIAD
jgi:uncharacterized RDD family membrane protein YckC